MKYVRKIVALLIGVAFFAAVVISLGMIFAVRNINVTMITYADEEERMKSYDEIKQSLSGFKGDSLVFLDENSIKKTLSGSNYSVVSCEKKYPCTINVTVKERLETFALFDGIKYTMYDNDGISLRSSAENVNINDDGSGSPNVELIGVLEGKVPEIAKIAATFKDKFKALRSMVTSISLDVRPDIEGYPDKLCFNLRCGLKIQLDDYADSTEEKISAVYEEYCKMTDRDKLGGTLRGYKNIAGEVKADHN